MTTRYLIAALAVAAVGFGGLTACKLDQTTASAGNGSGGGGSTTKTSTNFVPVGKPLTVGDKTDSGTYTLVSLKPGAKPTGDVAQFATPSPGNQYVLGDIQVEVTKGTVSVNPFYFSLQTTDNRKYDVTAALGFDPTLDAADIPAGQSIRGNILFEIPTAAKVKQVTVSSTLLTSVGGWTVS